MTSISALLILSFAAIVLPWVLWRFTPLKLFLPCAVFQICIGILIGPSFLGHFFPDMSSALLTSNIRQQVEGISAIAVLFFALITGLHIDTQQYRGKYFSFCFMGLTSVAVPFILGVLAALWIIDVLPNAMGAKADNVTFMLAVATAASVTALPVLAVILRDLGMIGTKMGQWSLGLAAINDSALWILLAVVLASSASIHGEGISPLLILLIILGYVAVMFIIVRPIMAQICRKLMQKNLTEGLVVIVTALAILSSLLTELMGLHYLIGAFLAGIILPIDIKHAVLQKIESAVFLLLIPYFFVATGIKVNFDFTSSEFLMLFLLTTAVTVFGKYIGTSIPAVFFGWNWRQSLGLGALMQTKGMMELAVLTILLQAELISNALFSSMILMTLLCTAISMPLTRIAVFNDKTLK